jgi:hypothetical protein
MSDLPKPPDPPPRPIDHPGGTVRTLTAAISALLSKLDMNMLALVILVGSGMYVISTTAVTERRLRHEEAKMMIQGCLIQRYPGIPTGLDR